MYSHKKNNGCLGKTISLPAPSMAEEFKHNLEVYIQVLRQEKEQAKVLADLRAHKRKINEQLKQYMLSLNLEEAYVKNTATVNRIPKRRILALKRPTVEAWAKEVMGSERSLQEVSRLYDAREVKTVEELVVTE